MTVLSLLVLAGCGFTPLYGKHGASASVADQLAATEIANIPDREGLVLRNSLMDRFYNHGRPAAPAYILEIKPLHERLTKLDITKTADATRVQLRFDGILILRDAATGQELLNRELKATTSYNILKSRFTTLVSEDNARLNALEDIARQIENQLALYFRRNSK